MASAFHPHGGPYDLSKHRARATVPLTAAELRQLRFHAKERLRLDREPTDDEIGVYIRLRLNMAEPPQGDDDPYGHDRTPGWFGRR